LALWFDFDNMIYCSLFTARRPVLDERLFFHQLKFDQECSEKLNTALADNMAYERLAMFFEVFA
jgi:hypothetical protein